MKNLCITQILQKQTMLDSFEDSLPPNDRHASVKFHRISLQTQVFFITTWLKGFLILLKSLK